MHHTKTKGDLGVAKVIARLVELGWVVGLPITEHAKYDLFAEKSGVIFRIQVKYVSAKNEKIEIKLESSWADKNGNHRRRRLQSDYDVLAAYCPDTDSCYFLKSEMLGSNGRSITVLIASKDFLAL
jgi:PD-(D/E)XK nuclease superfamily protein